MTVVRFFRAWAAPLGTVLAAASILGAAPCHATTVVVPDDYPTIQAAINSDADVIRIKEGTYVEDLTIARGLTLEPFPHAEFGPFADAFPRILGSAVVEQPTTGWVIGIRGVHIAGRLTLEDANYDDFSIADCRVDSGIVGAQPFSSRPLFLSIRGCIVTGGIYVSGWFGDITANTVLGGGVRVFTEGPPQIRGNYIAGPADAGIAISGHGDGGSVSGNTIVNCSKGIDVNSVLDLQITHNSVSGCKGTGIGARSRGVAWPNTVSDNVVQQCGGHGLELKALAATVTGNTILDVAGSGVWIDREGGDVVDLSTSVVQANRILRCGSDGIHFDHVGEVSGNVVGRTGGRGIVVLPTGTAINVHGNTSYWNSRAGFDLSSDAGGTVANNVAYANQREGLAWTGTGTPELTCNDWYANVGGATSGVAPGATDLAIDPYFCNVPQDDVHLAVFSPLRNTPSCGLIGALDVGCSEPTAVSDPPRAAAEFSCTPRPTSSGVRFSWRRLSEDGKVEIFDASGARRWKGEAGKNTDGLDWDVKDEAGNPVPAGVYFARIRAGSLQATTRVVVVR